MNRVSVAMAVYNGEKYLGEQIDSILIQLKNDDELVISYDCSSDRTLEIITEYGMNDNRVKVAINQHCGVVKNFENAVANCKNQIIMFADQDDIWDARKVGIIRAVFEDRGVTVAIHDARIVDENKRVIHRSSFECRGGSTSVLKNFIRLSYIGCSMAFRKEMVPIIVPFPTQKRSHDWWTGTMCSLFGKMIMINEPLILHRMHDNNATPKKRPPISHQIKVRWIILKNSIIRCWKYREVIKNVHRGIPVQEQKN